MCEHRNLSMFCIVLLNTNILFHQHFVCFHLASEGWQSTCFRFEWLSGLSFIDGGWDGVGVLVLVLVCKKTGLQYTQNLIIIITIIIINISMAHDPYPNRGHNVPYKK